LHFLIALRPKSPEYALLLARTAYASGNRTQAREVLRKYTEVFAKNPDLLDELESLRRQLAAPDP
jgi:hypothetical protein